jgi:hypothetical protein
LPMRAKSNVGAILPLRKCGLRQALVQLDVMDPVAIFITPARVRSWPCDVG